MRRGSPDLRNFYPRPPRGGRRRQPVQWPRRFSISIHALREEGDLPLGRNETARKISIHALREEGDVREDSQRRKDRNFYPRPPRGGRPSAFPPGRPGCRISIHALREEGDGFLAKMQTSRPYFYPRPPRGGRPYAGTPYHLFGRFLSTPSARRATEGDFLFIGWCCNFYPRPPRGGRRLVPEKKGRCRIFLSTPSARRATRQHADRRKGQMISIHALREEGDRVRLRCFCPEWISIHALREEGDVRDYVRARACQYISIHALREEGDNSRSSGG